MNELTLVKNSDSKAESGKTALWEGRTQDPGVISLEQEVDKRLEQIRTEHMDWAYKAGLNSSGINLQAKLDCGDKPSMWWISLLYERHPKLSPYLYVIYKLRAFELVLEESHSEKVTVLGADRRLQKALGQICKNTQANFKSGPCLSDNPPSPLKYRLYELIPAPIRALARFAHWFWNIRRKLPGISQFPRFSGSTSRKAATIATYFPNIDLHSAGQGRFRSRYWENLHDLLNEIADKESATGEHFVRWLFIHFPSPDLTFDDCIRLRDEFQKTGRDGLSFNFLEEFLTPKLLRSSIIRWLKLGGQAIRMSDSFARSCRFENSLFNFWPWMRAQWYESLAGWRGLERCLMNNAFKNYCRTAGAQRWTLFPLENCPWERMLTTAARANPDSGPVYGAQHSTLRPTDFRYFDAEKTFTYPDCAIFQPDKIAGNGESACGQWRQNKMPSNRLIEVEALRYLYLSEKKDKKPQDILPPEPGEPLASEGKRLLVLTSFFKDETSAHLELFARALAAKLFTGWQLVLKPHPYLLPGAWLENLPKEDRDKLRVSHSPLSLELTQGTSIWASNSTTASLEAVIRGLPVMVMAAKNDFDLCPIQNIPGLLRTATLEDVKNNLELLRPLKPEAGYLDLNPDLPSWRRLLENETDKTAIKEEA